MTFIPHTIVHGPQGCGKTSHATQLAAMFGATEVCDDWQGGPKPYARPGDRPVLFLTNTDMSDVESDEGLRVVSFEEAVALLVGNSPAKKSEIQHVFVYGTDLGHDYFDDFNTDLLQAHYGCAVRFNARDLAPGEIAQIARTLTMPTLFMGAGAYDNFDGTDVLLVAEFTDAMEEASGWYLCAGTVPPNMNAEEQVIYDGIAAFCRASHRAAAKWYIDPRTGQRKERNFGETIALAHSELSEALEAHRKDLPDDKLPDRPGAEVEFGDAMIRVADTSEYNGYDLAGAIIAKMRFNSIRPDHKTENRVKAGGKAY